MYAVAQHQIKIRKYELHNTFNNTDDYKSYMWSTFVRKT